MTSKKAGIAAWAVIATACLVYGPMAIEYMWRFFNPDAPQLWNQAFSSVVGHRMAEGAGSIHLEQQQVYAANRWLLLVHTSCGGLAIMFAVAQFSQRLRSRRPALHRTLGRIQVAVVIISMLAAMGYLLRTGPHATFDGPAFYAQLWVVAVATLLSSVLAVTAAVRRQIRMHQCLMAFNFALLLTAPALRVGYLLFGLAWPDQTQQVTNLATAAALPVFVIGGAIVASRRYDTRRPGPAHPPITLPRNVNRVVWASGPMALIALSVAFNQLVGGFDRVIAASLVVTLGALAVFTVMRARSGAAGNVIAASEWQIHQLAVVASPVTFAVLWPLYAIAWNTSQSFYAALLTATTIPLAFGYLVITWSRRNRASLAHSTIEVSAARTSLASLV